MVDMQGGEMIQPGTSSSPCGPLPCVVYQHLERVEVDQRYLPPAVAPAELHGTRQNLQHFRGPVKFCASEAVLALLAMPLHPSTHPPLHKVVLYRSSHEPFYEWDA